MSKIRDHYAGLTRRECCADCTKERCFISGTGQCGHPFKSNLHDAKPDVIDRIQHARKLIRMQAAEADR